MLWSSEFQQHFPLFFLEHGELDLGKCRPNKLSCTRNERRRGGINIWRRKHSLRSTHLKYRNYFHLILQFPHAFQTLRHLLADILQTKYHHKDKISPFLCFKSLTRARLTNLTSIPPKKKRTNTRARFKTRSCERVRFKNRLTAMYKNSWSLFQTNKFIWSIFQTRIFTLSIIDRRDRLGPKLPLG